MLLLGLLMLLLMMLRRLRLQCYGVYA